VHKQRTASSQILYSGHCTQYSHLVVIIETKLASVFLHCKKPPLQNSNIKILSANSIHAGELNYHIYSSQHPVINVINGKNWPVHNQVSVRATA